MYTLRPRYICICIITVLVTDVKAHIYEDSKWYQISNQYYINYDVRGTLVTKTLHSNGHCYYCTVVTLYGDVRVLRKNFRQ